MNKSVDLSVVMAVHNGADHLDESIRSILKQTYNNFEFIIINDGSTDRSEEIISEYAARDKRIAFIKQQNMGLAKALNRGIKIAKGKYIARQDADDVSTPDRFAAQMKLLESDRDIVLCGTWFMEENEGLGSKLRQYPIGDHELRKNLKYVNQFCHPSVIFSKKSFYKAGGYDENFVTSQDFELWIRIAQTGKIANIPEIHLKKRIGFSETISWEKRFQKGSMALKVISTHFDKWWNINPFKFILYYLPKMFYAYIPVSIVKSIRRIRYKNVHKSKIER